jgi:hypothetical protein
MAIKTNHNKCDTHGNDTIPEGRKKVRVMSCIESKSKSNEN